MIDRRGLMAAAAALSVAPAPGAMAQRRGDRLVINALGGLSDPNLWGSGEKPDWDRLIRDASASGMDALNITIGYVSGKDEPFEASVRDIAEWDARVRKYSDRLTKVWTANDIRRAQAAGRLGLIYGFQNAAMMGSDARRVDVFADLGVRIIQLTYNVRNQLGGGSLDREDQGLTAFGREVVARLNARRVMVDLSHSGRSICLDAARASTQPISINHTGCRALADLPRNKTDEELRLVAERGGFVGIYFMPFLRADGSQVRGDDVVAHIEHAIDICGEDAVGIGTDGPTTGIDDMPRWTAAFARDIERRRAAGISAPGERPDSYIFAIDMTGPEQFRILADKLRRRGHGAARIDKILGLNFLRYAERIWGG
ncbi:dipeptidase [Sphingomonas sp.]|uniref:dipeptidase n=1 Tax=Sphingomonas sp. TaxID=28214 RepID=UPI002DD62207|nr:membrane dipeptidase [Sphingomonas sp.]